MVDESVVIEDDGIARNGTISVRLGDAGTQTISAAERITALTVNAGSGNDAIARPPLDSLFQGSVTVNGGSGQNTIVGAADDPNVWSITGVDAGTLAVASVGTISFSNAQNIAGGNVHTPSSSRATVR